MLCRHKTQPPAPPQLVFTPLSKRRQLLGQTLLQAEVVCPTLRAAKHLQLRAAPALRLAQTTASQGRTVLKNVRLIWPAALLIVALDASAAMVFSDLASLGGSFRAANGINNQGVVAGGAQPAGDPGTQATTWLGGVVQGLGTLGGSFSVATAINNNGVVVGSAYLSGNTASHATSWAAGVATNLGTLGGSNSQAFGVSDSGIVVGYSAVLGNTANHAALWEGGTVTDLGTLGGSFSTAHDINSSRQVVGASFTSSGANRATLWDSSGVRDLGTLGGNYSYAYAINDAGLVVGNSTTSAAGSPTHAVLWNGQTKTDLGTLGGNFSSAQAVNNAGIVVGYSRLADNATFHATLWDQSGIVDLNTLLDSATVSAGWVLNSAWGVNDNGWVIGQASNTKLGLANRAFLLSSDDVVGQVSEPQGVALALAALVALGLSRKRLAQKE